MSRPTARRAVSIRVIATTTTVALIAAAVVSVGAVSERNTRRALSREIETRLVLEARNLALASAGAMLSEFPELTLVPLVKKMQTERPELAFVVVVDHRGHIQGHADPRQQDQEFTYPAGLMATPSTMPLLPGERMLVNRDLLVVESPVSHPTEPHLGSAIVAVRRAYIEAAVLAARREQFVYLVVLLAIGTVLGLVLLSRMLQPIGALRAGLERVGQGDFDTPVQIDDRTELGLLADTVNEMATRLSRARREAIERDRLAHELQLAREIQQRLLPQGSRAFGTHEMHGAHRAAAEVGGDYYDFFPLADGGVGIAIGDVSGKGLAGCLVTSMLSALLRALHGTHRSPRRLLIEIERLLNDTLKPGEFVTLFYGVLDPDHGRLVYASAAHTPLLVWRKSDGEVEWRPTRGIPIGAVRGGALEETLEDATVELAPGDLIIQFTDGISEAFDAHNQQFGFERVEQVVREHAPRGPEDVLTALTRAVANWTGGEPMDDETAIVVSRRPALVAVPVRSTETPAHRTLAEMDPLETLERAEARGLKLTLPAALDGLAGIGEWIERLPDLGDLGPAERQHLETALYEACTNVAEHGLKLDAERSFELWWVPAPNGDARAREGLDERVRCGFFVLRDRGFPFSPGRWQPQDLDNAERRLYGRGFGLDLIHLAMDQVVYRPATSAGNVTLLTFDPAKARTSRKEERHV